jgi:hypothetical protein
MPPKEKAKELVDKMLNEQSYSDELYDAKQCALIAVDEILLINKLQDIESQKYWEEVKQEIEKL